MKLQAGNDRHTVQYTQHIIRRFYGLQNTEDPLQ